MKASSPSAAGPIPGSSGPALGTEEAVELMPIIVKAFKMAGIGVGVWAWGYLGFSVAWIFVALFFHVASEECRKYKESKKAYALQAVLNEREAILSRVDDHSSWVGYQRQFFHCYNLFSRSFIITNILKISLMVTIKKGSFLSLGT